MNIVGATIAFGVLLGAAFASSAPPASPAPPAVPASPAYPALAAQMTFEQATHDLTSKDAGTRLRAAQMLKAAAYPEAAVPLAALVTDAVDEVQLEAIAAELNIFLAEKIVPRKRLGLVIEVRNAIAAAAAFAAGPLALGPEPVPVQVLTALRAAARDDNPRVALEALYAFGTLAAEPSGNARRDLLLASGPDLASMLGAPDPVVRFTAVRVLGRVFERRRGDPPVDSLVGDAVITGLNDADRTIRTAAMQTLGAMRYERAVQGLTDMFQRFGKGELAEASLDAIAHIGRPYSSPLLSSQLTNKSAAIRGIAMEGLGRTGDRLKAGEIDAALKNEHSDAVRLAGGFAAVLLTGAPITPIGDALTNAKLHDQARGYLVELAPGRTAMLARYLQDPDPQVRTDAADIFALAGDPAALPLLEPLARDASPQVAGAAARAIARLRRAPGKPISDAS
jgi:HEAT repeat protein